MAQDDDRPLIILVGSRSEEYRGYIVASIATRYRIWLLNSSPATWERPYLAGWTVVDLTDQAAIDRAARAVAAAGGAAGVFCFDETLVEKAARTSVELGFTTWDPEVVARCRDKDATRAAGRAAGLLQPASRAVATLAEAADFAAGVGYPVILKPRNFAGGVGVRKVNDPGGLAEAFAVTSGARMAGFDRFEAAVVVEEFVEGPEIAVDSVFFEGTGRPILVARKILGSEPPFEFDELGHDVCADDPLLADPALLEALRKSHAAVGFRTGITHTEFKLTPRGLCLIEINARMGGDHIPYLGWLASGYDESLAAADVAVGRAPAPVVATHHRAAAVRFAVAPHDMEVTAARRRDHLLRDPVHRIVLNVGPGSVLHLPPVAIARFGAVITVADTIEEARAAAAEPGRFLEISGRPLGAVVS